MVRARRRKIPEHPLKMGVGRVKDVVLVIAVNAAINRPLISKQGGDYYALCKVQRRLKKRR